MPINTDDQWGTYWIHAHSSVGPHNVPFVLKVLNLLTQGQYVDGLRTPLIVHPPKEVHKYDDEFTVVITDWYHTEHDVLNKQFISPSNPDGLVPMPGLFSRSFAFAIINLYILNFRFGAYLLCQGRKISAS